MSHPTLQKNIFDECNLSDDLQVLITLAIDGDEKAFKGIYDMIAGKMFSLCLRYAGNKSDAEDIFQEAIVKVYKSLAAYKGVGSFEGWVRRIFINISIDYLRKKQKFMHGELHENINVNSTELTGIKKLTQADLLKIIQQLPNGYRTIVNLYLVEQYSHREISEMLGISESTSKSQLSRAKLILQKSISESNDQYQ